MFPLSKRGGFKLTYNQQKGIVLELQSMQPYRNATQHGLFSTTSMFGCLGNTIASTYSLFAC